MDFNSANALQRKPSCRGQKLQQKLSTEVYPTASIVVNFHSIKLYLFVALTSIRGWICQLKIVGGCFFRCSDLIDSWQTSHRIKSSLNPRKNKTLTFELKLGFEISISTIHADVCFFYFSQICYKLKVNKRHFLSQKLYNSYL